MGKSWTLVVDVYLYTNIEHADSNVNDVVKGLVKGVVKVVLKDIVNDIVTGI
ncbi:MAG: hypothetical protein COB30_005035 [Ectothiorhodospiraceae bacterium]|nr:hypothetical protein [Ectothiorhodospiraceae bacterium]